MKLSESSRGGQKLCVYMLLAALLGSTSFAQGVVQCAQVPCDDVRTVAATGTGVPVEHDFVAAAATTYYVTLTDLGTQYQTPRPLATLKLAITANDALVNLTPIAGSTPLGTTTQLVVDGANSVATNGVAVASFTAATAGTYRLHVIGGPGSSNAPGIIGLEVSGTQGGAALQSWSDSIALPGTPPPSAQGVLQQNFSISAAATGTYQISVTDLALPQSLLAPPPVILLSNSTVIAILPDPTNGNALTKTVTLSAGSYQLFATGLAATNASGGLFSVSLTPLSAGAAAAAAAWAVPVGSTVAVGGAVQLTPGSSYSLTLNDLTFPVALTQVEAMAVDIRQGGLAAATLRAPGSQTFVAAGGAAADTYQIYSVGQAATVPGAGSYSVQILGAGTALTGSAQAVTTTGGSLQAFTFTANPSGAGSYTAALTDLQIPAPLGPTDFAVVQGGTLLGTPRTSPGNIALNVGANSGALTLLAFASSSSTAGSLMDVNLSDSTGKLVFDQPQGIGAAFKPTQISITAPGTYQFKLLDLAWPASFSQSGGQLTGVISQGGTVVGEFFGGGTLSSIPVTATGNYYLSIIATPSGTDLAGTYALNVGPAPAAPTVSLSTDAGNVTSGGTVHLIWTATGATSCAGSGGGWSGTFTGAQAASNSVTSPPISADTTFTLTCTGPGGQTAATASVSVGAISASPAKGGGGALGELLLLALGFSVFARSSRSCGVRGS